MQRPTATLSIQDGNVAREKNQKQSSNRASQLEQINNSLCDISDIDAGVERRGRKRAPSVDECVEQLVNGVEQGGPPRKKRKGYNGWTMHLSIIWDQSPRLPGETKAARRTRVVRHAKETWNESRLKL